MKKYDDSGNLSIDFLIGFTIFLLAFIWVVSMIPGLLINLQGYTIDYDAVAYRTGVVLAEDPGEPSLPTSVNPWEDLVSSKGVIRFGLAQSKDTPNILSQRKVNKFFCLSMFSYPVDYQNRTIFGDYPYQFNISLIEVGSSYPSHYVGDNIPATSSYGSIRRFVKIKGPSVGIINASFAGTNHPEYFDGENETVHDFSILLNNTELLHGNVKDKSFQIDPSRDLIVLNLTNLNETMLSDRKDCFNINLANITVRNSQLIKLEPLPEITSVIDGVQYNQSSTLQKNISNNISLLFDPPSYWAGIDQIYINLTFNLIPKTSIQNPSCYTPVVGIFSRPDPVRGSRFLNNTFKSPFKYNYDSDKTRMIQPQLRDAILEIKVGSGARTITEIVIAQLKADFAWGATSGSPITVQFTDKSTGSPVEWDWDFGDGTSHGITNNPTHIYGSQGIYTVKLIIKDATGVSATKTTNIDLSAPVALFSGTPLSGNEPLNVQFTDASTGGVPTSWKWEFNKTSGGGWTQFNTTQNPWMTFTEGMYDIRLTATNLFGSNNLTKFSYIVVTTPLPPTVTTITPNTGVNTTTISITNLAGANFLTAATVKLNRTGYADITGTGVTVVSPTQITCTFDLTNKVAGLWNVAVINPDGKSGVLPNGFTIKKPAYYRDITVTNSPAIANYQMRVNVPYDAHMKTDFGDIRFNGSDGTTVYDYWMETKTDGVSAVFWVEVPTASTTTFRMYYGDSSATTTSSGTNTFGFFSDGSSLTGWTTSATPPTVDNTIGQPLPSFKAVGGRYAYRDIGLTANRVLEYDGYVISGTTDLCNLYFLTNAAGSGQMFRLESRAATSSGFASTASWASWSAPAGYGPVTAGAWHKVQIVLNSTYARGAVDGTDYGSRVFSNNGGYIAVHGDGATVTGGNFDNIRVRQYSAPEPTTSIGPEIIV
jgi:PKD repeat protein